MRAGELRHRVALQSPGGAPDAAGYEAVEWTTEATVYAKIEPLSGREQFVAAAAQSARSHLITLRYGSAIAALDETWSVLWGTRRFLIDLKRNVGERDRTIELLCIERPADAAADHAPAVLLNSGGFLLLNSGGRLSLAG